MLCYDTLRKKDGFYGRRPPHSKIAVTCETRGYSQDVLETATGLGVSY